MSRKRFLSAAALGCSLLAAGTTAGAADASPVVSSAAVGPWSAPREMSGPLTNSTEAPALLVAGTHAFAWWRVSNGPGSSGDPMSSALVSGISTTSPGTPRTLGGVTSPPAVYGVEGLATVRRRDRRQTALRTPVPGPDPARTAPDPPTADVQVALGRGPQHIGTFVTLQRQAALISDPVVAADRRGNVAVAWVQRDGGSDHLRLALRNPGGRFAAPRPSPPPASATAPA